MIVSKQRRLKGENRDEVASKKHHRTTQRADFTSFNFPLSFKLVLLHGLKNQCGKPRGPALQKSHVASFEAKSINRTAPVPSLSLVTVYTMGGAWHSELPVWTLRLWWSLLWGGQHPGSAQPPWSCCAAHAPSASILTAPPCQGGGAQPHPHCSKGDCYF